MFKCRWLFKVHETLLTESIVCCISFVFVHHWIHLQPASHRAPFDAVKESTMKYARNTWIELYDDDEFENYLLELYQKCGLPKKEG
jgi:hypothetical protein